MYGSLSRYSHPRQWSTGLPTAGEGVCGAVAAGCGAQAELCRAVSPIFNKAMFIAHLRKDAVILANQH